MAAPIAFHIPQVSPKEFNKSIPLVFGELIPLAICSPPMKKTRRDLEEWEKAECLALKAIFDAWNSAKPKAERLTQETAGERVGLSQGGFSNYLNGQRALNKEVAVTFNKAFGFQIERFSPRLAAEIADMASAAGDQSYQKDDKYQSATPEHRQAVDELVDKLLDLSPAQALKVKQAMELLMPTDDTRKD